MTSCDLAIVGAGPAGAAAAIQARRQGLRVLLFERNAVGGAARSANRIENLPGHPNGIAGIDFAKKLAEQLRRHGVRVIRREVDAIRKRGGLFEIGAGGKRWTARLVIVARGLAGRRLGIPGEKRLAHRMPAYPVPAETPHAGRRVLVIGGGDTAFDQAIAFSRRASSVIVALRGARPRAIPRLVAAARRRGVVIRAGHRPVAVRTTADGLSMSFDTGAGRAAIAADLVALCVGKEPHPRALWSGRRPPAGLLLAGDGDERNWRHVAVAAGDGVAKAMAASAALERNR